MKISCIYFYLFFSVYLQASPRNDLLDGIELFETGKISEAMVVLKPISRNGNSTASYYLGLIYDPVFNRIPFSSKHVRYDKEIEKQSWIRQ